MRFLAITLLAAVTVTGKEKKLSTNPFTTCNWHHILLSLRQFAHSTKIFEQYLYFYIFLYN